MQDSVRANHKSDIINQKLFRGALLFRSRQCRSQRLFRNRADFLRKRAHIHSVRDVVAKNARNKFNLGRCDCENIAGYLIFFQDLG